MLEVVLHPQKGKCDEKNKNWKLFKAAQRGDLEETKRLLKTADPMWLNCEALRWASANGHAECVKLLLPGSDPRAFDECALEWATQDNRTQCVALLLLFSTPEKINECFVLALDKRYQEIFDLLYPLSDAQAALGHLQKKMDNHMNANQQSNQHIEESIEILKEQILARETQKDILSGIEEHAQTPNQKRMSKKI